MKSLSLLTLLRDNASAKKSFKVHQQRYCGNFLFEECEKAPIAEANYRQTPHIYVHE